MISPQDIEKLALLSRLKLNEEEKAKFAKEIESILAYVGQVNEAAGEGQKELPANRNVFRQDSEPHDSGIFTEEILSQAPEREGNYIKVKKILPTQNF